MSGTAPTVIRSIVTDDEFGGFRITIPTPEGGRFGFGCGLVVCAFGAALALSYIAADPRRNFSDGVIWLGWCVLPGILLAYKTASAWTGREVVVIEGKTLVVRWEIAGYCRVRTFELAEVRNLRPVRANDNTEANCVAFDHGGKTHHFGVGLSEIEVIRLVKTIRQRFTIRDDLDDAEPLPVVT